MKKIVLVLMIAAGLCGFSTSAQEPGLVIAGSQKASALPRAAKQFLHTFYEFTPVSECQKEFLSGDYEVRLVNGTEIEFNSVGRILEIEGPDDVALPEAVVWAVLPEQGADLLAMTGAMDSVEKIEVDAQGRYRVELQTGSPRVVMFDTLGAPLPKR